MITKEQQRQNLIEYLHKLISIDLNIVQIRQLRDFFYKQFNINKINKDMDAMVYLYCETKKENEQLKRELILMKQIANFYLNKKHDETNK